MKFSAPTSFRVWFAFVGSGLLGIIGYYITIPLVSEVAFELVMIGFAYLVFATFPRKK